MSILRSYDIVTHDSAVWAELPAMWGKMLLIMCVLFLNARNEIDSP